MQAALQLASLWLSSQDGRLQTALPWLEQRQQEPEPLGLSRAVSLGAGLASGPPCRCAASRLGCSSVELSHGHAALTAAPNPRYAVRPE